MVKLTISAGRSDEKTVFNIQSNGVVKPLDAESKVVFMVDSLVKEVSGGTKSQQQRKRKQLRKLMQVSSSVLGLMVGMTSPVSANSLLTTNSTVEPITVDKIFEFGQTLAVLSVSAGIALSMVLLAIAGMYRMLRKQREAQEWTSDIIKGLVQVLISIPIVYILYVLAQALFSSLPGLSGLF